jgi:uncharacterized cupredoxin-like copper-binding protein
VSLTISPQIKIVALVGLVLVLLAAGASMVLGHSSSPSANGTHVIVHKHAKPTHKTTSVTVVKKGAHGTKVKHVTVRTTPNHHVVVKTKTTVVHTKNRTAVVRRGNLVYSDLPAPLQWQLAKHHIVVVSIYSANSNVDSISVAEAQAGANEAGAGFLLVNVLDDSLAGPLTALLPGGGLLPDPGILIYRSPGNVAMRIDGFVDRDAVAQAVANAFAGQNGPLTSTTAAAATTATDGTYTPPTP